MLRTSKQRFKRRATGWLRTCSCSCAMAAYSSRSACVTAVITHGLRSDYRDWHLPGDGPHKARQLAGNRSGDDIGRLAGPGELAISGAQPQLRLPGDLAG